MAKATCSIDGCERDAWARGWCSTHYARWRKYGDPGPAENLIRGRYDAVKPCTLDGCDEPAKARGWCVFHYTRWKLTGDPTTPLERNFYPKGTLCAFQGCGRPRRRYEWCHIHSQQHERTGRVWEITPWHDGDACVVCGEQTGQKRGFRKYCSGRCQQLFYEFNGNVPDTYRCVICRGEFPFEVEGRRRVNPRVTQCPRCRQDRRKHGVSVLWLADRDGTDCGICGVTVDMTLAHPEPMRPSVDHILPRAKGGTNDPENLQLAHLRCNQLKSDRTDWAMPTA